MTTSKMKIYITIGLSILNASSTVNFLILTIVENMALMKTIEAVEPGIVGLLE